MRSRVTGWVRALVYWALVEEGSTRGLGLMRICIALMLWTRFADFFLIHTDSSPPEVALALAFHASTLLLLLGRWTRTASAVCAAIVVFGYHYLLPFEQHTAWDSNNIKLLVTTTALLALAPSGRSYSLDRWRALARAERERRPPPAERAPLWSFRLLGLLASTVYLSTWANKTGEPYLTGDRLASIFATHYTGSTMLDGDLWEGLMMGGALGVSLLEGLLVFGLAVPRIRAAVAAAGVVLHGSFTMLFRVFTFSPNMVLLYLPWFPTARVHGLVERVCGPGGSPEARPVEVARARRLLRAAAMVAVVSLLAMIAAQELSGSAPPARVRLLADRTDTFLREAGTDRRDRRHRDRKDMQLWVRP